MAVNARLARPNPISGQVPHANMVKPVQAPTTPSPRSIPGTLEYIPTTPTAMNAKPGPIENQRQRMMFQNPQTNVTHPQSAIDWRVRGDSAGKRRAKREANPALPVARWAVFADRPAASAGEGCGRVASASFWEAAWTSTP